MIRSGTIHTIHELQIQGKSIREIARILGIARNAVRRYLLCSPPPVRVQGTLLMSNDLRILSTEIIVRTSHLQQAQL
jgi:predicted transcriptional regulator